jgi:ribose/xylose/arabinose/galactoside ABC-type transport system permease subunit
MRRRDVLSIYSSGLTELVLAALGFAVLLSGGMQILARALDSPFDATGALLFSWQAIVLLALWPGQGFWTIRRRTAQGREHSIIGRPCEDDIIASNRRAARRMARLHD